MADSVHSSPARSFGEPSQSSLTGSETELDTVGLVTSGTGGERTIIDGWLKFRDVKKWKQRWGVVTKLSPAAETNCCEHDLLMLR